MKAYTDLSQSRTLAEFLPLESADCFWDYDEMQKFHRISWFEEGYNKESQLILNENNVCAWSLAALLSVLPLGIYDEFDSNDYELEIDMIDKMPRYIRLGDISHSKFPWDFEKDTLIDNVVESIIWLNDNNYFEL